MGNIDCRKTWKNTRDNGYCEDFGLGQPLLPTGCAVLEPSWAEVGAKWGLLAKVTESRVDVAAISDWHGAFGRFGANMQKPSNYNSRRPTFLSGFASCSCTSCR